MIGKQQHRTGRDGLAGNETTERHRPVSPIMILAGEVLPPKEPGARTSRRSGDHRRLEWIPGRVAIAEVRRGVRPHQCRYYCQNEIINVREQHDDRRTGGQPVQPVGQVDTVRGGQDDSDEQHDGADLADMCPT